MKLSLTSILLLFILYTPLYSQYEIRDDKTPEQLVKDILIGGDIEISNVVYGGAPRQQSIGYFFNNGYIDNGIILCTGNTEVTIGPNDTDMATLPQSPTGIENWPGDFDLDTASNTQTNDATFIQFDFVALSDSVRFNFQFGSEEYPEYVCGEYNDVFLFLIRNMTNPEPYRNIAILPNDEKVSINTINNGQTGQFSTCNPDPNCNEANDFCCSEVDCIKTNAQYYIDNTGGQTLQFDGLTTVLTAKTDVIACQTYRIKLAIGDVFDGALDSGVFIEGGSFKTSDLEYEVITPNNSGTIIENCNAAQVRFYLNSPKPIDYPINFTFTGTASDGTDFIIDNLNPIIPQGELETTINIEALLDNLVEGTETIELELQIGCTATTTISINLQDKSTNSPILSCGTQTENSVTINWQNHPEYESFIITVNDNQTYNTTNDSIQINNLWFNDTIKVEVTPIDTLGCEVESSIIFCNTLCPVTEYRVDSISCKNDADGKIILSDFIPNSTINWSNGASGAINRDLLAGNYSVTITNEENCPEVIDFELINPDTFIVDAFVNINELFIGETAILSTDKTGDHSWYPATGLSCFDCPTPIASPLETTTYWVTVESENGCEAEDSIIIIVNRKETDVFVPTGFSPNGDGNNDVIFVNGLNIKNVEIFRIYDRWGELVFEQKNFEANNPVHGWNGTFKGELLDPSIFVYYVEVQTENLDKIIKKGDFQLFR